MNVSGRLFIYKIKEGKVTSIRQNNAITYAARNILVDMLLGNSELKYLAPLNIGEVDKNNKAFKPESDNLIKLSTDEIASFDIGGHNTVAYSDIETPVSITTLSITINAPEGILKNGEVFNAIGVFNNTENPATDIGEASLFSFATLPDSIIVEEGAAYVINYWYEIR